MQPVLIDRAHPLRHSVEALISGAYARCYGANVHHFPDRLLAVLDDTGAAQCATGIRDSGAGFFSEQYLDSPVENAIAAAAGVPVSRSEILELTALGAVRPGALPMLLQSFARFGLNDGYRWGLFTATAKLRRFAARIDVTLHDLTAADPNRLADATAWGSYYEYAPRVCAVDGHGISSWLQAPVPAVNDAGQAGTVAAIAEGTAS
jgi:hypothetical protein